MGVALRVMYPLAIFSVKMSFCAMYARLFPDWKSQQFIYGMMAFVISSGVTLVILTLCECLPLSVWWSVRAHSHCIKPASIIIAITTGSFNIFSDALLLAFVVYKISKLSAAPNLAPTDRLQSL